MPTQRDLARALIDRHGVSYAERTATMLGDGAEQLVDEHGGDLRRLHEGANSSDDIDKPLQRFPGIGPTGAAIFCREAQAVWTDLWPYVDSKAQQGAKAVGLPVAPGRLGRLVDRPDLPRLLAGCIDVASNRRAADEVRAAARERK